MRYAVTPLVLILLVLTASGCGRRPADGQALAVVEGEAITLEEFEGRLSKLPEHYQAIVEKNKKKFLEDLIMQKLLYKEALATGIDKDPDTQALLDEAQRKILIATFIQQNVDGAVDIGEEDIAAYYEENREQFSVPARWQAAHILVDTLEEARDIKEALDEGGDFAELAKERSKDSTGAEGGEVGFFSKGQLVPEFEEACFALEIGGISDPVETKFGYHVIKLLAKEEAGIQDFKKVSGIIRKELERKLKQDRLEAVLAGLKEKADITINEDLLTAGEPEARQEEGDVEEAEQGGETKE